MILYNKEKGSLWISRPGIYNSIYTSERSEREILGVFRCWNGHFFDKCCRYIKHFCRHTKKVMSYQYTSPSSTDYIPPVKFPRLADFPRIFCQLGGPWPPRPPLWARHWCPWTQPTYSFTLPRCIIIVKPIMPISLLNFMQGTAIIFKV